MKRGETLRHDGESGPQWVTLRRRRGPSVSCAAGCGATIDPGEDYVETTGFWDGRAGRVLMHPACHDELERLCSEAGGDEIEFERVAQYAREDGRVFVPASKVWREAGP